MIGQNCKRWELEEEEEEVGGGGRGGWVDNHQQFDQAV